MLGEGNRILQYDLLRIIGAFGVVVLHVSSDRYFDCFPSLEWDIRNIYDSMVRWSVPVFVMISGSLYLNLKKEISIKTLFSKYTRRIVYIYFFWSIIYALSYYDNMPNGLGEFVYRILFGPFHFWFLKMLIGFYLIVPLLRIIVTNKKTEEYFICLALVSNFITPMLLVLFRETNGFLLELLENYNDEFGVKIALGYAGYFVLGLYLFNYYLKSMQKMIIYCLGGGSFVSVCILTYNISYRNGTPYTYFYGNMNMFTLFESVSIFILIKDMGMAHFKKNSTLLLNMAKCSLGIYIIHPLIMKIIYDSLGIGTAYMNTLYFIPVYATLIFLLSYAITLLLVRIPVIKNFMT